MRPDEHKRKKNAEYKNKHGISICKSTQNHGRSKSEQIEAEEKVETKEENVVCSSELIGLDRPVDIT